MNITATIEYLCRAGSPLNSIQATKKELKQFFEKTCTEIADKQTDREQISECILTIVDNKTNKKICINFDIVNYASCGCEFAHILFYDTFETLCDEVVETLAACSSVELKNVTVDFYIKAFF